MIFVFSYLMNAVSYCCQRLQGRCCQCQMTLSAPKNSSTTTKKDGGGNCNHWLSDYITQWVWCCKATSLKEAKHTRGVVYYKLFFFQLHHLCNLSEVISCSGPFGAFHKDSIHMCCIVPPRDFMETARYRLVLIANGKSILPLQFPFNF